MSAAPELRGAVAPADVALLETLSAAFLAAGRPLKPREIFLGIKGDFWQIKFVLKNKLN